MRHYSKQIKINVHTLLFYKYIPDIMEKRGPHRINHMLHASKSKQEGKFLMGGAHEPASDGATIVFQGDCTEYAEEFARNDPYVQNGLVQHYTIKKWNVVDVGVPEDYNKV